MWTSSTWYGQCLWHLTEMYFKITLHNTKETLLNRELYKHIHATLDHLKHLYHCTRYGYCFFKWQKLICLCEIANNFLNWSLLSTLFLFAINHDLVSTYYLGTNTKKKAYLQYHSQLMIYVRRVLIRVNVAQLLLYNMNDITYIFNGLYIQKVRFKLFCRLHIEKCPFTFQIVDREF